MQVTLKAANPAGHFDSRIDWCGPRVALVISLLSLLWTTALMTNFSFVLIGPEKLDLVFGDMARRLLHFDMTIDPAAIQFEAFNHDGRSYTYFGIFPGLLRIPAVLAGVGDYPFARISCLTALGILAFSTIRMTQAAINVTLTTPAARRFAIAGIISVAFSGPPIYVLASAAIYHEAIFWAAAGTAIFNWIVIRRVCAAQQLSRAEFALLALTAGCVLLTRVTGGAALYAALALLAIWPVLASFISDGSQSGMTALGGMLRQVAPAVVIAILFVAAEAAVNYGRWGNPLLIAPMEYYNVVAMKDHPALRLARLARHGMVDIMRIPLAMLHYGFGIKVDQVFSTVFDEHFDGIEGPRVVAVLCVPWMWICAIAGINHIRSTPLRSSRLVPLLLANSVGFLMALTVPWLALRYTFDGCGLVAVLAAVGTRSLVQGANVATARPFWRVMRLDYIAIIMTVIGVTVSHATLLRYKINYSGTAPVTRYWLSRQLQPIVCPDASLNPDVRLDDFLPLVTKSCPPLW